MPADVLVAISYAAEVCPIALRGYVTTYLNFCWGWGQLLGVGVIKSMFGRTDQWAYRIPYGLMVCLPFERPIRNANEISGCGTPLS
jgi:SP family general alpha glucoside:H+ symporter-like MFS transporter